MSSTSTSYAGIGSRLTPKPILDLMFRIGVKAAQSGLTLRSGAADGADAAFEAGAITGAGHREIYLPWKGFNGHASNLFGPSQWAFDMAKQFHPNWDACSRGARAMHARNCHQVLGLNLNDPVSFVACWTPGASGNGGTGQAIRLARKLDIVIIDLGNPDMVDFIESELA